MADNNISTNASPTKNHDDDNDVDDKIPVSKMTSEPPTQQAQGATNSSNVGTVQSEETHTVLSHDDALSRFEDVNNNAAPDLTIVYQRLMQIFTSNIGGALGDGACDLQGINVFDGSHFNMQRYVYNPMKPLILIEDAKKRIWLGGIFTMLNSRLVRSIIQFVAAEQLDIQNCDMLLSEQPGDNVLRNLSIEMARMAFNAEPIPLRRQDSIFVYSVFEFMSMYPRVTSHIHESFMMKNKRTGKTHVTGAETLSKLKNQSAASGAAAAMVTGTTTTSGTMASKAATIVTAPCPTTGIASTVASHAIKAPTSTTSVVTAPVTTSGATTSTVAAVTSSTSAPIATTVASAVSSAAAVSAPVTTATTSVAASPSGPVPPGIGAGGSMPPPDPEDPGGDVIDFAKLRVQGQMSRMLHNFVDIMRPIRMRDLGLLFTLVILIMLNVYSPSVDHCKLVQPVGCEQFRVAHAIFSTHPIIDSSFKPECPKLNRVEYARWLNTIRQFTDDAIVGGAAAFANVVGRGIDRVFRTDIAAHVKYIVPSKYIAGAEEYYACLDKFPAPIEIVYANQILMRYWMMFFLLILALCVVDSRRIYYFYLGITEGPRLLDTRPHSHLVVPLLYQKALFVDYIVVDFPGSLFGLFNAIYFGTFVRRERMSYELFVALMDPRITAGSVENAMDYDRVMTNMKLRAGLENRINLDRYEASEYNVAYNTVRLAWHYHMSQKRHVPADFKFGTNGGLYAFGYRVNDVRTSKRAASIRKDVVFRLRTVCKQRNQIVQVGLGCEDQVAAMPSPNRTDGLSLLVGAIVRLAPMLPPTPVPFTIFIRQHLHRWLEGMFSPMPFNTDFSYQHWRDTRDYTETRKNELDKARAEMFEPPWAYTADGFIKAETYVGYKVPRWICPTSDWTKVRIGPYISAIEHHVFLSERFIKLIPGPLRTAHLWRRLVSVMKHYIERDVTSAESHHRIEYVTIMLEIYRFFLRDCQSFETEEVIEMIEKTMTNPGQPTLQTPYFIILLLVILKSGRMDTSFVNVMLFMLIYDMLNLFRFNLDFSHGRYRSYEILQEVMDEITRLPRRPVNSDFGMSDLDGIFEGDDSLTTALPGQMLTDRMYLDIGVKLEGRFSHELSGTDFCGMIFDEEERIMITDILSTYIGFGWAMDAYLGVKPVRKLELLRARAFSLLYQYNSCPVLHELALYALRITQHIDLERFFRKNRSVSQYERKQMYEAYMALRHERVFVNRCGPRTRALVERLFNITVDMQLRAEHKLRHTSTLQPLNLFDSSVYPVDWVHYRQNFVFRFTDEQISQRNYADIVTTPCHDPFEPGFFATYGNQIVGRNGMVGREAVRFYFGLD
jgi:hypothetical protein